MENPSNFFYNIFFSFMEGKIGRQKRFFPQLQQHESQPKALPTTRA